VRIAFSGSHQVGKSTLLQHVAVVFPRYTTVDEPYYLLEEDGYECADPPSIDDFQAQLERSLAELEDSQEQGQRDVLFDRSPVDILAYLLAHEDAAGFSPDDWLVRTRHAVRTLDLVVFVPIEESDRIRLPSSQDAGYRLAVHERLHELLVDDAIGCESELLTVHGSVRERVDQVVSRINAGESRRPKPRP